MRTFMAAMALALVGALATVAPASAGRAHSVPVSGDWSITGSQVVDQQQIGSLTYLRELGTTASTGDLAGTTSFDLRIFLRPDFSSFGWATETFTGTVPGLGTGTMFWLERATGGADGSALVEALVVGGTGDFAGLHGSIRYTSPLCLPDSCGGTYAGVLNR
jgi:hypothetical protein